MNRIIKFRGKSVLNDEWIYGDLVHRTNSPKTISPVQINGIGIKEETVGQFTGILDKNGKEIYEGDIVERIVKNWRNFGFIGEVIFDNGKFGIKHKNRIREVVDDFSYSEEWNDGHAHGFILCKYEWKGNIYDNPELIKKE